MDLHREGQLAGQVIAKSYEREFRLRMEEAAEKIISEMTGDLLAKTILNVDNDGRVCVTVRLRRQEDSYFGGSQ